MIAAGHAVKQRHCSFPDSFLMALSPSVLLMLMMYDGSITIPRTLQGIHENQSYKLPPLIIRHLWNGCPCWIRPFPQFLDHLIGHISFSEVAVLCEDLSIDEDLRWYVNLGSSSTEETSKSEWTTRQPSSMRLVIPGISGFHLSLGNARTLWISFEF